MQSFATILALAGAASAAAIMPRQNSGSHCCFNVNVAGAVAGPLGELADGQLRVGPGYTGIQFCYYNGTSSIVDTLGRGCIVTPPTSQYQCDTGLTATTATSGITVASNGSIEHGGNAVWYECNSGAGYNIYANSPGAAGSQCSRVTLNAVGGNCSAPVVSSSSSRVSVVPTSSSVVSTSSKAANTTSSILSTSSRAANTTTTTTTVIVTSGRPVNSTSSVVATTSRPATTSSGSVVVVTSTVTSTRPASSSSAPASSSSAPASSSKPATSSSRSIVVVTSTVTSSKPASSSSAPVSSSSAPVSSTKSASSSSAPASSSSAPASSSKLASSSSAPASSSSAPASSSRPASTSSAASTTSTAAPTSSARPTTIVTATTAVPASVCVPVTVTAPASTVTVTVTAASSTSSRLATSSAVAASSSFAPATSSKPATTSSAATNTSSVSAISSSTARASSSSSSAAPASSACPTGLGQNYQYPHLIVPVSPAHPTTAYGTQYFAGINSTFSTIFNFDVPVSYAGHTCTLEFLLPQKSQLVTSDYTLSGTGVIGFEQLNGTATQATTFANQPAVGRNFGNFTITPGSSSIIASGPCAAGTTVSYELIARGNTSLYYFQDYNPSAIGLYIVEC